jgi:hypothetical protein
MALSDEPKVTSVGQILWQWYNTDINRLKMSALVSKLSTPLRYNLKIMGIRCQLNHSSTALLCSRESFPSTSSYGGPHNHTIDVTQ